MINKWLFLFLLTTSTCAESHQDDETKTDALSAEIIMEKAYEKAGGEFWRRPQTLTLKGHAIFYKDGQSFKNERHYMWRVFESTKEDAHTATGKVRIESIRNGKPMILLTYDGENTYDLNGKQEKSDADQQWASNFGYGAIRHVFDKGYTIEKIEDEVIKDKEAYMIKVTDPSGGESVFGIDQNDFSIVKVGFQSPRGWHERIYSQFFQKEEYDWLQSGRVELFYGGKLSNEVFWEDFEVNEVLPDSLFVLSE